MIMTVAWTALLIAGEPITVVRGLALALIIGGVALLRLTEA
ncbi:hypothetical protein [Microlunatus sp. GCM10028923]